MMAFDERRKGVENYITAQDMALILEKIYRREFINRQVSERCLGLLLAQKVNDRIPKKLPAQTPVAHKTGLERFVFHDAGIVFTAHGDFLICVLTRTDAGSKKAKNFIADLALAMFESYGPSEEARYSMAR
jgi:beta-lactamase class A